MMNYNKRQIDDIVLASWKSFGLAQGFDYSAGMFRSYINTTAFNYVYLSDEIIAIDDILNHFGKLPFTWIVNDDYHSLQDLLGKNGFYCDESWEGMACDLQNLENVTSDSITIRLVDDENSLQDWLDTASLGFGLSRQFLEAFARPLYLFDNQRFFVAYIDGKPASVVLSTFCGDATSIAYVVTREEKRHQGCGRAVTMAAMQDAKDNGCFVAALQSSEMAQNMYKHLGFCGVGGYTIFRR